MAKKFFYNRVYNTRRTIINLIIIGVCVIGIIICFILVSNFQGENLETPEGSVSLKQEATVEVNDEFTKEIFFSKIENVDLEDIEVTYPDNYSISTPGTYEVTLRISGKNYTTKLVVVDTIKPELELKEVKINENGSYNATDFVKSCTDNSGGDCIISFYQSGTDEDGNAVDYSKYTKEGTYPIKISAKDNTGNENILETKLTITKSGSTTTPSVSTTCKYGDNTYDTEMYLITKDITTNGCAVSLDLYNDATTAAEINKIMETETTRIKKDVEALNLTGVLSLNRKKSAIVNKSGQGIVGYELEITVTITNSNNESETVVQYKLNSNGQREFITNPYKLAK